MLSGANYAVPLFRQYSCKIQPPPQHGTTRVAFCIGLKPETWNYSVLPIKRLVSCNSFCKRRTCSANCFWLGRTSLILMLLYVATPIGVLMPLNDHWTSILSISEQTSNPIVGFSSSVSFRYYLNMMPPRHQRKRQWKISTNLVEFFGTQFCTNLVQNFFLSLSIKQMLFCLGGFANSL